MMETVLNYLIPIAMGVTLIVLGLGVLNMFNNNAKARNRSNKLMRLRIIAQFIAVVLLMTLLYISGQSGQ